MVTQRPFPRRGVLAPLAVVLMLGIGSPAAAEVTVSGREPLLFQVGERRVEVRVGPKLISGEGLHLRRGPEGLRGTLDGQPVRLAWTEEGVVTGQVAGERVRLVVRQRIPEPGLRVEGWFGVEPAELVLAPVSISGTLGGCDYRLPLAGNRYSGWRTCELTRGPPVPVVLRLPENLVPLGLTEEGALLALLLSAEALPPASSPEETPGVGGAGTPSP
jgi:hypothetical protein